MPRLRRHAIHALRALATGAALLAAAPVTSFAQTAVAESAASTSSFSHGRVRFFVDPPVGGASIDVTGRPFAPRTDWLALACDAAGCALRDAVLDAVAEEPTSCGSDERRQRLAWTLTDGPSTQRVVLAVAVDAASAGLRVGPVATAYSGTGPLPRLPDGDGLGVSIDAAAGPLILRTVVAQSVATDDRDASPLFSWQLELVQGDRRQVLGALGLPTDAGAVGAPPEGFLRWVGDLDRDGRPDLLLAMDTDATVFMLLLSSFAQPGEFVGEAGVFVRPARR